MDFEDTKHSKPKLRISFNPNVCYGVLRYRLSQDILGDEINEYAKSLLNHLKSGKYKDAIKILEHIKNLRIEELGPKGKEAKYFVIEYLKKVCTSDIISENFHEECELNKDTDFCKIYNSIIKENNEASNLLDEFIVNEFRKLVYDRLDYLAGPVFEKIKGYGRYGIYKLIGESHFNDKLDLKGVLEYVADLLDASSDRIKKHIPNTPKIFDKSHVIKCITIMSLLAKEFWPFKDYIKRKSDKLPDFIRMVCYFSLYTRWDVDDIIGYIKDLYNSLYISELSVINYKQENLDELVEILSNLGLLIKFNYKLLEFASKLVLEDSTVRSKQEILEGLAGAIKVMVEKNVPSKFVEDLFYYAYMYSKFKEIIRISTFIKNFGWPGAKDVIDRATRDPLWDMSHL